VRGRSSFQYHTVHKQVDAVQVYEQTIDAFRPQIVIVRQAANVLDLLEYFARTKRPSSLAEVSATLGWPRSSTFNLLTTLAQRGFLYEPRPRAGYYPSIKWMSLLQGIAETQQLPEELCQAVDEVARNTGETVAIAAPAGANAVLVHVVESPELIRFSAQIGYQMPIHTTAGGRALLAQYSARERASVLKKAKFLEYAHRSLTSIEQVELELKRAAARGWHENIEGYSADMVGVALPVQLKDRPLAIVVGGPLHRMRRRTDQIATTLRRALKRYLTSVTVK
jgi:DNA-binding IclR family transcriptional regulator